jgi:hypothetical protein
VSNRTDALRPAQKAFLATFTGSNRTALAESAFIAGWLAGKREPTERHVSYVCPQCHWTLDVNHADISQISRGNHAASLDELRAVLCGVGIVGQIDGYDVIRRDSVIDLIDRRIAPA